MKVKAKKLCLYYKLIIPQPNDGGDSGGNRRVSSVSEETFKDESLCTSQKHFI